MKKKKKPYFIYFISASTTGECDQKSKGNTKKGQILLHLGDGYVLYPYIPAT